jgi:hypothetical protein
VGGLRVAQPPSPCEALAARPRRRQRRRRRRGQHGGGPARRRRRPAARGPRQPRRLRRAARQREGPVLRRPPAPARAAAVGARGRGRRWRLCPRQCQRRQRHRLRPAAPSGPRLRARLGAAQPHQLFRRLPGAPAGRGARGAGRRTGRRRRVRLRPPRYCRLWALSAVHHRLPGPLAGRLGRRCALGRRWPRERCAPRRLPARAARLPRRCPSPTTARSSTNRNLLPLFAPA